MLKKYDRLGRQRYARMRVKAGFTTPRQILTGKHKGLVWKAYLGTYNAQEATRLREGYKEYIARLRGTGINVVNTRIVFSPTRKGKYRLNHLQEEVPQETLVSNRLKTCTGTEALQHFRTLLKLVRKIEGYNSRNETQIGADIAPRNIALIREGPVLIDLYPPLLKLGKHEDAFQTRQIRKQLPSVIRTILFPKYAKKRAKNRVNRNTKASTMKSLLLRHFTKARPELREELFEIMEEKL